MKREAITTLLGIIFFIALGIPVLSLLDPINTFSSKCDNKVLKYKFQDKVRITDGFYKDTKGIIKSVALYCLTVDGEAVTRYKVLIPPNKETVRIREKHMEKLK